MNVVAQIAMFLEQAISDIQRPDEFPPFVGDSTVFLVKDDKVMATAFVVGIRDNSQGNIRRLYLVTARHNIERAGPGTILTARHNIKGRKFIECEYKTDDFIPHPATDIAVHPLNLLAKLQAERIPLSALDQHWIDDYVMVRKDELDTGAISWGSHVLVTSMFHLHTGQDIMQPIFRFGRIAMIPIDQVEVSLGYSKQQTEAILIETMV